MEITSAKRSKKDIHRMSIYIEGEYAFSMSEDDYLAMHLYDRKEITEEEVEYIKSTLNFNAAKSAAVRFLSLRLRTEKEVRDKLKDKGFDNDIVEKTINELKSMGYINNMLYAQKYIFDRSKLKPKSKRLLKLELLNRGISENIADEVLDGWNVDEVTVAGGLVKRKFGKYDLGDEKIIRKIYMFLTHRGFSGEVIKEVINNITDT